MEADLSPSRTEKLEGDPQEGSAEEAAGSHPDLLTPVYHHSPLRENTHKIDSLDIFDNVLYAKPGSKLAFLQFFEWGFG